MIQFKMNNEAIKRIQKNTRDLIKDPTKQMNSEIASFLGSRAQKYAPYASGKLRSGIKGEVFGLGARLSVRSGIPYALPQEFGWHTPTSRRKIQGRHYIGRTISEFWKSEWPKVKKRFTERAVKNWTRNG